MTAVGRPLTLISQADFGSRIVSSKDSKDRTSLEKLIYGGGWCYMLNDRTGNQRVVNGSITVLLST
jgi:hypothetical protein